MIHILDPGPLTTVQDLGRFGHLRSGIPPSGPMDRYACVLANRLVDNDANAALLECTVLGPRFRVDAACAIAVTGADMPITVNGATVPGWSTLKLAAGDVVKLGAARRAVRSYIAISGGIDVPIVLGSRATYLRGALGGFSGRALRTGDAIATFAAPLPRPRRVAPASVPSYAGAAVAHIIFGPQDDRFTSAAQSALLANQYTVLPQSDRMGLRLQGNPIEHLRGHDIISDGIALGSIQVPGNGQPIVLLVDRQSTGGYTKIATVCSFDIATIGQLRPGQSLTFRAVTLTQANEMRRHAEAQLSRATMEPM